MTQTSHGMVFLGPGEPLQLREFSLPAPGPGELLVEVLCCTLCGSDLHTYQGHRAVECPTLLGHEILGRVAALPKESVPTDVDGKQLEIGDRVSWSVAASCGKCFYCAKGLPQKCERLFKYGHEPLAGDHPLSGGLADYCHLAAGTAVVRVPDDLPDDIACTANCATATVAAALRVAGDCRGESVLVLGTGMLGLTACAMARQAGAHEIIAADVNSQRVARARQFGATQDVHIQDGTRNLHAVVSDVSAGRGADVVFEMSGSPDAVELGFELLRTGGRMILVGSVFPSRPVQLIPEAIVRKLARIEGIHNYTPNDLCTALRFLEQTHVAYPFAELIVGSFSLPDAEAAFRRAIDAGALRVAVRPGT